MRLTICIICYCLLCIKYMSAVSNAEFCMNMSICEFIDSPTVISHDIWPIEGTKGYKEEALIFLLYICVDGDAGIVRHSFSSD